MLSLIGVWGKPHTIEWRVERTRVMEDMDRVTLVGVDDLHAPPAHKAHTYVLNNYSYMPIALHILWQEQVWMHIMGRILLASDVLVRGCIVDNFFCERPIELCDKCEADEAGRPYRVDGNEMPDECLNCQLHQALPRTAIAKRTKRGHTQAGKTVGWVLSHAFLFLLWFFVVSVSFRPG